MNNDAPTGPPPRRRGGPNGGAEHRARGNARLGVDWVPLAIRDELTALAARHGISKRAMLCALIQMAFREKRWGLRKK
jgi:hypothetical protein